MVVTYECNECGSLHTTLDRGVEKTGFCAFCKTNRTFKLAAPPLNLTVSELSDSEDEPSGSKYLRKIPTNADGLSDVYHVLIGFDVVCHPTAHAIKKLLVAGKRGKGDRLQDLKEARDAITRAIEEEERK